MNIEGIRKVAISMLNMNIEPTSIEPFVQHPFTNVKMSIIRGNGRMKIVNLDEEGDLRKWREEMREQINQMTLSEILMIMDKRYRLVFLKFIKGFLTDKEIGRYLAEIWTTMEYNNQDSDVSIPEVIELFKSADKKMLMNQDEYEKYCHLPDEMTIYRGVTSYNQDNKEAVSWTLDKNMAKWFLLRFKDGKKNGKVLEQKISKQRILCYFQYEDSVSYMTFIAYNSRYR